MTRELRVGFFADMSLFRQFFPLVTKYRLYRQLLFN